jgi:peptide deformylase
VGVQKRFFVYDIGEGPRTLVNPVIKESRGEWVYDEGCLSVPGLSFDIVRPKEIHLVGVDLDGNDVSFEADELLARLFQHELDHLDGILILDRTAPEQRREALRTLRDGG